MYLYLHSRFLGGPFLTTILSLDVDEMTTQGDIGGSELFFAQS